MDILSHLEEKHESKKSWAKRMLDRVNKSVCPECGRRVFIPLEGWRRDAVTEESLDTDDDVVVMCTDMGHWAGMLSSCKEKK